MFVAPVFNVPTLTSPLTSKATVGEVVPIPTLVLLLSKLSKPFSMFNALVLLLTKSRLVALINDRVAPFMDILSPDASPRVTEPVVLKSPETVSVLVGAVVPTPTLEFEVSIPNSPPTVNAVEEDVSPKLTSPEVEVRDKAPVVRVKPLEAVSVLENLPVPTTSSVAPGNVVPIPIFEEDSYITLLTTVFASENLDI